MRESVGGEAAGGGGGGRGGGGAGTELKTKTPLVNVGNNGITLTHAWFHLEVVNLIHITHQTMPVQTLHASQLRIACNKTQESAQASDSSSTLNAR